MGIIHRKSLDGRADDYRRDVGNEADSLIRLSKKSVPIIKALFVQARREVPIERKRASMPTVAET